MAAFDLRSASLHLSQYIETSSSYQNTKTLVHFYDPMVIIVSPNKLAPDGMVGVSELVDRFYASSKKVIFKNPMLSLSPSRFLIVDMLISFVFHVFLRFLQVVMSRSCFDDTKVLFDTRLSYRL